MKSVSEALTSIIVFSTLLVITIFVTMYAFVNTYSEPWLTEYYYLRQALLSVTSNIPVVINPLGGGSYTVSIPSARMAIGWRDYAEINIYVNSSKALTLSCKTIYTKIGIPIITHENIVYGVRSEVVNDTRLLPRLREYYSEGYTLLELDTCRFSAIVERTGNFSGVVYYLRLIYINLTPITPSQSVNRSYTVSTYIGGTPQIMTYRNVYGLGIEFRYRDGETSYIAMGDLGASPPLVLTIIVYNVVVEVK